LLHDLAKIPATFDDPNLVSRAGLVPVMAFAERAGLPGLAGEHVRIARPCGVNPQVKVPGIVVGMIGGAAGIAAKPQQLCRQVLSSFYGRHCDVEDRPRVMAMANTPSDSASIWPIPSPAASSPSGASRRRTGGFRTRPTARRPLSPVMPGPRGRTCALVPQHARTMREAIPRRGGQPGKRQMG
jgi:hypothetical protein